LTNSLIPEATNRKPTGLIEGTPEYTATVKGTLPGIVSRVLRRNPPVTAVANVVEWTKVATVATRKACKTTPIGGSGIRSTPMCGAKQIVVQ
jgi:hypothetical protein